MKIGYNMLFLIDSLNVINAKNDNVAPAAIKSSIINIIIDPTPETMAYLAGFDKIAVIPSTEAKQKFFPLKAICI
jgi:hypothetical protein